MNTFSLIKSLIIIYSLINCNFVSLQNLNSEQIHLSFGTNSSNEIIVTWVSLNETNNVIPTVTYYPKNHPLNVSIVYGKSDKFIDDGEAKKVRFIHRVTLSNLIPSTEYTYSVIGHSNWFNFKTLDPNSKEQKIVIFGDLGYENEHLLTSLTNEVNDNYVSALIQVGDLAYDLHTDNGDVGDLFMNMIEPLASRIPFQVVVGNHEEKYNFSHYDARFTMTDEKCKVKNNHFYSFNIGLVHFVVYSTEYYRFTEYGTVQIENQYNWIVKDLTEATLPENRAKRPWIIVLSMYKLIY